MNKCYSCGATYSGYSCPNCALIRAGRENAEMISGAVRDAERQRQAEADAAREAIRRSLLTPEQREQEDIERAEQARINAIHAEIQAKENETHENAVNAMTFFGWSFAAIAIGCFFSKTLYGYLANPSSISSPYSYIASFYHWTALMPFKVLSALYEGSRAFVYQKISYPNMALVAFSAALIAFAWLSLSFVYRLFRHIGRVLTIVFAAPFVFGLAWFFGSIFLSWLLKK